MADDKLLVLVVCRHMGGDQVLMEKAPELEFWFLISGRISRFGLSCYCNECVCG